MAIQSALAHSNSLYDGRQSGRHATFPRRSELRRRLDNFTVSPTVHKYSLDLHGEMTEEA